MKEEKAAQGGGKKTKASKNKTSLVANQVQTRKVPIPPHRFTPLKTNWINIYTPLVDHLKLQVRMNPRRKSVELRTSKHTLDDS
ncbi:hypothetical protein BN1708_018339, partial [Verticillium longisporum]